MPSVFAVTTIVPTKSGLLWYPAEFIETDLDALADTIANDGIVKCTKLVLEPGASGSLRRVIDRQELILGASAIVMIAPMHLTIVEETGDGPPQHPRQHR